MICELFGEFGLIIIIRDLMYFLRTTAKKPLEIPSVPIKFTLVSAWLRGLKQNSKEQQMKRSEQTL